MPLNYFVFVFKLTQLVLTKTSFRADMNWYPYIVLSNNVITFILSVAALYYSIKVLFKKVLLFKILKFSPIVSIFFIYGLTFSIVTVLYCLFLFIFWRPDSVIYEARELYVHGLVTGKLVSLNPVLGAFLCIDRCATILAPTKYDEKFKKIHTFICVICVVGILGISIWMTLSLNPFPQSSQTNCMFYGCFLTPVVLWQTQTQKIVTTCVNMAGCGLLFILLTFYLKNCSSVTLRINRTVILILLLTTVCDFSPSIISNIFQSVGFYKSVLRHYHELFVPGVFLHLPSRNHTFHPLHVSRSPQISFKSPLPKQRDKFP